MQKSCLYRGHGGVIQGYIGRMKKKMDATGFLGFRV